MANRVFYLLRLGPGDEPHLLAARSDAGVEAFIPTWGLVPVPQVGARLDDEVCAARVDTELALELIDAKFGPSITLDELAAITTRSSDGC